MNAIVLAPDDSLAENSRGAVGSGVNQRKVTIRRTALFGEETGFHKETQETKEFSSLRNDRYCLLVCGHFSSVLLVRTTIFPQF